MKFCCRTTTFIVWRTSNPVHIIVNYDREWNCAEELSSRACVLVPSCVVANRNAISIFQPIVLLPVDAGDELFDF